MCCAIRNLHNFSPIQDFPAIHAANGNSNVALHFGHVSKIIFRNLHHPCSDLETPAFSNSAHTFAALRERPPTQFSLAHARPSQLAPANHRAISCDISKFRSVSTLLPNMMIRIPVTEVLPYV